MNDTGVLPIAELFVIMIICLGIGFVIVFVINAITDPRRKH